MAIWFERHTRRNFGLMIAAVALAGTQFISSAAAQNCINYQGKIFCEEQRQVLPMESGDYQGYWKNSGVSLIESVQVEPGRVLVTRVAGGVGQGNTAIYNQLTEDTYVSNAGHKVIIVGPTRFYWTAKDGGNRTDYTLQATGGPRLSSGRYLGFWKDGTPLMENVEVGNGFVLLQRIGGGVGEGNVTEYRQQLPGVFLSSKGHKVVVTGAGGFVWTNNKGRNRVEYTQRQ